MKKRILTLVMMLALVVALMPATVFAAGVTGSVTSNNNAPAITSVTLQTAGGTGTAAMTPQTEFLLQIVATDDNTIDDIATIDIWVYHDTTVGAGTPPGTPTWDSDDGVIYKWTKSGDVWSMENGSITTSWAITTVNSVTPADMTGTSGTWKLSFTPGKLAVETTVSDTDEWNFKVTVTDAAAATASDSSELLNAMAAYSSIATDVGSITFGGAGIALGTTTYITTPGDYNFATQVLSNDAYALQSNTTTTWTTGSDTITLDPSGTPDAAGEFALNIDDAGTVSSLTTPQPVTTSAANITDHAADARVATAASANETTADQDFYMSLKLYSQGIPVGTYSGTITMTVVNS